MKVGGGMGLSTVKALSVRLFLALTLACLPLVACDRTDQPTSLSAATPKVPAQAAPAGDGPNRIETMTVEYSGVKTALTLNGRVNYGEDRFSRISSQLQGRVLEVQAKLGDRVKTGDILAAIDSPDIAAAYSTYVKETSELDFAVRAYELARDLYESKAIPFKDWKQAENDLNKERAEFRQAKERLLSLRVSAEELDKPIARQQITSRFELKSPLTGTVVERNVTPGQLVNGDSTQVLFTVADLDKLQVVADLYERDVNLVKVGQVAALSVESYPGTSFPAVISAIGDLVDPSTRIITVRALVNNETHQLKPGMFARLNIDVGDTTPFIAVPREAVLEIDGHDFVYVVEGASQYVKRQVKVAPAAGNQARILEGLTPGEQIVTKGAVFIKGQETKVPTG